MDAPFNHSYNVKLGAEVNVFSSTSGMILLAYQTEEIRNKVIDQCQDAKDIGMVQLAHKLNKNHSNSFKCCGN